jgi:hypothetical protein
MADSVVVTSHQGYFSRLAGSFVGVLIGIFLVPGSILLISWNEYRTVHRTRGLLEAESVVVQVPDPFEISNTLDQRLVHFSGVATTEETLSDQEFSIHRPVLRLERQVEMYQWVEHEETRTRDKIGGGRETVKTYEYRREWQPDRVDSQRFHETSGHNNPHPRFTSKEIIAKRATLGAFEFRPALVSFVNAWKDVQLDFHSLLANFDGETKQSFRMDGDRLYFRSTPTESNSPQVGDLRIQFREVEPTLVSVLSKQVGSRLEPFRTSNGEAIESVELGQISAADMLNSLRLQNSMFAWIFRGIGWLLCCVAFGLITGPVKAIANFIPLFSGIVGFATGFLAFLLGTTIALITIGIAWIAVRPLLGVSLLVVAGLGIYWMMRRRSKPELPMAVLVE